MKYLIINPERTFGGDGRYTKKEVDAIFLQPYTDDYGIPEVEII